VTESRKKNINLQKIQLMTSFEEKIWYPLIEAFELAKEKEFEIMFNRLCNKFHDKIIDIIKFKFNCHVEMATDCYHEAILVLLLNINNRKEMYFKTERDFFNYMYVITLRKAIEFIIRVPSTSNIDKAEGITFVPKYLNQPSGNLFKDLYDGKNDIEAFLKSELESVKLLELRIVKNYSYEKIRTLAEYSNYTKESLRQKVSRGLKRYKEFIKT